MYNDDVCFCDPVSMHEQKKCKGDTKKAHAKVSIVKNNYAILWVSKYYATISFLQFGLISILQGTLSVDTAAGSGAGETVWLTHSQPGIAHSLLLYKFAEMKGIIVLNAIELSVSLSKATMASLQKTKYNHKRKNPIQRGTRKRGLEWDKWKKGKRW